jgi:transcription elongation factor Elf1
MGGRERCRQKTFTTSAGSLAGMVHCPECDGEISEESDVEFLDLDAKMAGLFRSSKRFYVVACNDCGAAIGSGVAGGGG